MLFVYDGLGQLVRVVDIANGAITADHTYLWCGYVRCAAHDNAQTGSPISTWYFGEGAIISGTAYYYYYYVTDELGSVNELVTSSGSIASQFTYDPYGNRTTVSGTVIPDVGYAGYFYHAVSGLDFALYRAYDPVHARWLNRDPIGKAGGINLYAYARESGSLYRPIRIETGRSISVTSAGCRGRAGLGLSNISRCRLRICWQHLRPSHWLVRGDGA